jgi:hypothetical protein
MPKPASPGGVADLDQPAFIGIDKRREKWIYLTGESNCPRPTGRALLSWAIVLVFCFCIDFTKLRLKPVWIDARAARRRDPRLLAKGGASGSNPARCKHGDRGRMTLAAFSYLLAGNRNMKAAS